jgi:hypothetical protein
MLRGFRWQFVAFLVAAIVFVAGLALREPAPPAPEATPEAPRRLPCRRLPSSMMARLRSTARR